MNSGAEYDAILFDLFGTLVSDAGNAAEGASELLRSLPRERWACVTSCSRRMALALFARAQLPEPKVLIAAADVAAGKPAPDGYLLAAERLRVTPQRCLVVEDSVNGIAAGRRAGMDVAAILGGRSRGFASAATFWITSLRDFGLEVQTNGAIALRQ